jgi:hypothetical protein
MSPEPRLGRKVISEVMVRTANQQTALVELTESIRSFPSYGSNEDSESIKVVDHRPFMNSASASNPRVHSKAVVRTGSAVEHKDSRAANPLRSASASGGPVASSHSSGPVEYEGVARSALRDPTLRHGHRSRHPSERVQRYGHNRHCGRLSRRHSGPVPISRGRLSRKLTSRLSRRVPDQFTNAASRSSHQPCGVPCSSLSQSTQPSF